MDSDLDALRMKRLAELQQVKNENKIKYNSVFYREVKLQETVAIISNNNRNNSNKLKSKEFTLLLNY